MYLNRTRVNAMKKEKKQLNYNLMSCVFIYVWAVIFFIASLSIEDQASRTFRRCSAVLPFCWPPCFSSPS